MPNMKSWICILQQLGFCWGEALWRDYCLSDVPFQLHCNHVFHLFGNNQYYYVNRPLTNIVQRTRGYHPYKCSWLPNRSHIWRPCHEVLRAQSGVARHSFHHTQDIMARKRPKKVGSLLRRNIMTTVAATAVVGMSTSSAHFVRLLSVSLPSSLYPSPLLLRRSSESATAVVRWWSIQLLTPEAQNCS